MLLGPRPSRVVSRDDENYIEGDRGAGVYIHVGDGLSLEIVEERHLTGVDFNLSRGDFANIAKAARSGAAQTVISAPNAPFHLAVSHEGTGIQIVGRVKRKGINMVGLATISTTPRASTTPGSASAAIRTGGPSSTDGIPSRRSGRERTTRICR